MADRGKRTEVSIDVGVGETPRHPTPRPDDPFRIAVIGDFSGRSSAAADPAAPPAWSERPPVFVDRDDLDTAISAFAPALTVDLPEVWQTVRFANLDDFHPDRLYERLPLFRSLRETRNRLADPAGFAQAASALAATDDEAGPGEGGGLLDLVVDRTAPATADVDEVLAGDFNAIVRRLVRPHLVPGESPEQAALLAGVDREIARQMRAVLHHPAVQALEALWRGVDFLTRRVETSTTLKIYLIDATKDELTSELVDDDITRSGLFRFLRRPPFDPQAARPWSVLLAAHLFGHDPADREHLTGMNRLARALGAPWVGAAAPDMLGLDSFEPLDRVDNAALKPPAWWSEVRQGEDAMWGSLVLPRFLLRLPYGREADPCDVIPFEELDPEPDHDRLLWGNLVWAVGVLLGRAFAASGWAMRAGSELTIESLPLHVYRRGDVATTKPCAEVLLRDDTAHHIVDQGIMPFRSAKDGDVIRLVRLQSIGMPPTPIHGAWVTGA